VKTEARALALAVIALTSAAAAQEPAGPPPPAAGKGSAGAEVHELLPDIGRIGAQVGALGGASWNPFGFGSGIQAAGYIDLPLFRAAGGKVSYEVLMAFSQAREPLGPVSRSRLRLLQVSPFGLKYTLRRWDRHRIRPYVAAGIDFTIVSERDEDSRRRPREVTAFGIPAGAGDIETGFHGAGGLELRVLPGLSLNLDYRYTAVGSSDRLHTAGAGLGFHF
jgi:opacity protein-like surface antigen